MEEVKVLVENQGVPVFVDVAGPSGIFPTVFTQLSNQNEQVKQETDDHKVNIHLPTQPNGTVCQTSGSELNKALSSIPTPPKSEKLRCTEQSKDGQCRYLTDSEDRLIRHIRKVHRGENPFQCTMCDYTTYNKAVFEDHVRVHQGIKPFTCSFCPYRSSSKKNAKKHEQIHRNDNPLKCKQCGFIAKHVPSLESHNRKHLREIPCDECDYKARDSKDYLRHKRTHARLTAACYSCQHCDASFPEVRSLRCHNNRKRRCAECDVIICTKQLHKKHMITVHNKKSECDRGFVCAICQWSSTSKPRVLLHLIHHPGQTVDELVVDVSVLRTFGIMK